VRSTTHDPLVKRADGRFQLSLELIASALSSWELAQRALVHRRDAGADVRKARALARDCTEIKVRRDRVLATRSTIRSFGAGPKEPPPPEKALQPPR
jgi:hypothetical protein